MHLLGIILPPLYLIGAGINAFINPHLRWRTRPLFAVFGVNLLAIWLLVKETRPDFFFMCLALGAAIGLAWVGITLLRWFDLIVPRFYRQYALMMGGISTLWWLLAFLG